VGGIPEQMYSTVCEYIQKTYPTAKRVVSFYADLPDAPPWMAAAETMSKKIRYAVAGQRAVPGGYPELRPFAQKLMSYNPDIIDLSGGGGATGGLQGAIVKQIRETGYTGIIMQPTVPPPGIMESLSPHS